MPRRLALLLAACTIGGVADRAPAAELVDAAGFQLFAGGEASAAMAAEDRGQFNTEQYGEDTLRLVQLRLTLELRAGTHLAVLSELRQINDIRTQVYALYLRVRPWREGHFDIQAGIVPPVFGAYPRRAYATDDPLIGRPLAFQYRTALRAHSPSSLGDLLDRRAGGWPAPYAWNGTPDTGLPLVATESWDTGLQARFRTDKIEAAAALTQGSPSDPRVRDDNSGKAIAARLAWTPVVGLVAGVSAERGRYLDRAVEASLGGAPPQQEVLGADLEYSRGHWVVRAEGVRSRWGAPFGVSGSGQNLTAWSALLEMRFKVAAGISLAARADRLAFGDVAADTRSVPWEIDVTRFEAACDVTPRRNVLLKVGLQHDRRDGGVVPRQTFLAAQAVLWF